MRGEKWERATALTEAAMLLERIGEAEKRENARFKDSIQTRDRQGHIKYHNACELLSIAKRVRDIR